MTVTRSCDADANPIRAYVRVHRNGRALDFCAHHYGVHAPALVRGGWDIVDDARGELNEDKLKDAPRNSVSEALNILASE
jgi:hypothetical protein